MKIIYINKNTTTEETKNILTQQLNEARAELTKQREEREHAEAKRLERMYEFALSGLNEGIDSNVVVAGIVDLLTVTRSRTMVYRID